MHRFYWLAAFVLSITTALAPSSQAARDLETLARPATSLQLVVLEVEGCIYCNVFRRQLLTSYEASRQAKTMPIRFVDINDPALGDLGLTEPVGIVPTFVVLENNQEIGRIPGLMGHHDFFKAIDYILIGR